MEALPLAFTTGWASGINAYACVLILGLLGRFADVAEVPHALTGNGVLMAAGALFAFEFVADKKASLRLAINTSPEPVTNIAASSAEDVAVAGVVLLAAFHPTAALITAAVLLVTGLASVYFAIRAIRRGLARFRAWRDRRRAPAAGTSVA
jgi:succinate dehydrogenase/fumarate reductase flavoprotein subunit